MLHVVAAVAALLLGAPEIFAPGVVSGAANDGSPTFSPDGNTLLFARSTTWGVILESHRAGGAWSAPRIASFSGTWNDWAPEFSPDGRYVVFVSLRPKLGANLWRVDRTAGGWGVPVRLPAAVNIGRSQWKPSIVADGSIYFTYVTKSGKRLYCSRFVRGAYQPAQPVSFSDGTHGDVDPEVAPDESFMVFASNGRVGGDPLDHLFIAYRAGGTWGAPVPLRYAGDDARGRSTDNEPHFSPDLRTLYFSSDRILPPPQFPRTPQQAQADLARIDSWDNGNLNAWSVGVASLQVSVEAQLRAMDDADCFYSKHADWVAYEKTLAPEYVEIDADGKRTGRAGIVTEFSAPSQSTVTACSTQVTSVKRAGDRVYVYGTYSETGTQGPKRTPYRSVERIRDTWKRANGTWLQTESLAYEMTYWLAGKMIAHQVLRSP